MASNQIPMRTYSQREQNTIMFLMILLLVIGQGSIDIYLPSMPAIASVFMVKDNLIKLTITVFLIGYAIFQLIYGPISDRYGRRPVLFFSLVLYVLSSAICMLAPGITILLIARFVQGIAAAAPNTLSRAIIRDSFDGKHLAKATSYLTMSWSLIPILAPVFGGYIQHYLGWRMNFAFLALFGCIAFGFTFYFVPETRMKHLRNAQSFGQVFKNYREVITNRIFVYNLFCNTLMLGIFLGISVMGPFLFQKSLGLTAVGYGWVTLFISIGYFLGSLINTRLIERLPIPTVNLLGYIISITSALVLLILALLDLFNIYVIVLPACGILFGMGFIYANSMTAMFTPFHHISGSASALYGCLILLGASVLTTIAAHLPVETQMYLAILLSSLIISSFFIYWFFARKVIFFRDK